MSTLTVNLPRPHEAQRHIKDTRSRFNVIALGRRAGKTALGIDLCVEPDVVSLPVGWFAPTYKDMLEVWEECRSRFREIITRSSVQERRMEFITAGRLEFWSLDNNHDAGRGRKYRRVIIDEAGLVPHLLKVWDEAIRPTLADYQGDAYFLGTPKGHNGFWHLWRRGNDEHEKDWASYQMPSSVNPFIDVAEIDAMRRELPERRFQQEIEAQFLDDAGGVFRGVLEAVGADVIAAGERGRQYVIGVDVAQSVDYTVATVIDVATGHVVHIDRFNRVAYPALVDRLHALWERFNRCPMIVEQNSIGQPVIEMMWAQGMSVQPFVTTSATKTQIIQALQSAFEHGRIRIPDDPVLIGELQAYEGARLASGMRYGAPDGMHDDCVMSLAFAWHGASSSGPLLYF